MVVIAQRRRYVVSLALYGDQSEWVLREVAEDIRDRLIQDPEITQAADATTSSTHAICSAVRDSIKI